MRRLRLAAWVLVSTVCAPRPSALRFVCWFNPLPFSCDSHADDMDAAVAKVKGAATAADAGGGGSAGGGGADDAPASDGEGKYELMAIISHLGKNTGSGHYICHIKKVRLTLQPPSLRAIDESLGNGVMHAPSW